MIIAEDTTTADKLLMVLTIRITAGTIVGSHSTLRQVLLLVVSSLPVPEQIISVVN